ncbi:MAG: DUF429 domain-containing protein [Nitrososphaeria archaeon]
MSRVIGIDLAGSEKRNTGVCLMENLHARTFIVHRDNEILDLVSRFGGEVVAIDAPLSIPRGRKSLENRCGPHLRECDRQLLSRKIRFFPLTLGPMRKLTERGMKLKRYLEDKGYRVVEVYPGGAQDVLKIPRKSKDLEKLRTGLESMGLEGMSDKMSHDELDAVTAALVGLLYILGGCEEYGDIGEGTIVMPKDNASMILNMLKSHR